MIKFDFSMQSATTWYEYLHKLNTNSSILLTPNGNDISRAERLMQEKFPGPYNLYYTYDSKRNLMIYALDFENKEEEIAWKLKWS